MTTEQEAAFDYDKWLRTRNQRQSYLLLSHCLRELGYDLDKTKKLLIKLEEK
jgi:hypothetical protein